MKNFGFIATLKNESKKTSKMDWLMVRGKPNSILNISKNKNHQNHIIKK